VMKILSWNVRGLGGFAKRPEVRKLINEKNPFIVCIQETNCLLLRTFCVHLCGVLRLNLIFFARQWGRLGVY